MSKIRGFELVSQFTDETLLPRRETAHAAGYDLKAAETTEIAAGEIKLVPTGVKAYMQAGEVLYLFDRSSNPRKKGLVLINSVGVIDGDYYGNPANEGHIFAQMKISLMRLLWSKLANALFKVFSCLSWLLTVTKQTAFVQAALVQLGNK